MNNNYKINLIFYLADFSHGGAGNSIIKLCKNLDKKKYNIYLLSLGKNYYKNELKNKSIFFYELKNKRAITAVYFIRKFLKNNQTFKDLNTIFISNINYANVLSVIFLRKIHNIKIILIERTPLNELDIFFSLKDFFKKIIIKFLMIKFYKYADLVIANSKKTCKQLKLLTNGRVTYVYPPSIKKIYKHKKKYQGKLLKILFVGRISAEKNLSFILENLKRLNLVKFTLFIVGDGPQLRSLKKSSKSYNYNGKIMFLGFKTITKKYFLKSDIFINSSYYEGFPNSVVEAINYNLPVFCSNSEGGINEILLNQKYGTIFKKEIRYSLIEKINSYIKNNEYYKSKSFLAKQGLVRFTEDKNLEKYNKIFRKII
jgi:glycosyltransferase involved in cell wall biosynthesis